MKAAQKAEAAKIQVKITILVLVVLLSALGLFLSDALLMPFVKWIICFICCPFFFFLPCCVIVAHHYLNCPSCL